MNKQTVTRHYKGGCIILKSKRQALYFYTNVLLYNVVSLQGRENLINSGEMNSDTFFILERVEKKYEMRAEEIIK